jgi:hypothetical protein
VEPRTSNILDPIHPTLDSKVWNKPNAPEPMLKEEHRKWIIDTIWHILDQAGYDGMDKWLSLVFTGSLTTYQYSDRSDIDTSLFIDTEQFPEWSRAEMIVLMVDKLDDLLLPGTPHPLQGFVMPQGIAKEDVYKPGLRSGWDVIDRFWVQPPERNRAHDIQQEMQDTYTYALQVGDKMDRLLKYEPEKAAMYWHQIHRRRRKDQQGGKGDFSESNIAYKMLVNTPGLIPRIEKALGEHIAL